MKEKVNDSIALFIFSFHFLVLFSPPTFSQEVVSDIKVRSILAGGVVYMLDCENGFGGGNVAASIGPDGILLVDDMFKDITKKLQLTLKKISDKEIRMVINSHFHGDHIEGNTVLSPSAVIVAHENTFKRLTVSPTPAWVTPQVIPHITFSDKLRLHFNGEEIQVFHLPDGHTDNDVFVYFTKSNVIHMGDTFFHGMFTAVYKEEGGNLMQLISNLTKVLSDLPADVAVIPGHGPLATKTDLTNAVRILQETTTIVRAGINAGKSLKQLQEQNVLADYTTLEEGGGQTTDQYLSMLYKALSE